MDLEEGVVEKVVVESNSNPLEDVYFLRELFPYLTVESLKAARLVNKSWSELASPVLDSKGMVYFDGHYDEEEDPPPPDSQEEYRDVKTYLKTGINKTINPVNICFSKGAKYTEQFDCILQFLYFYGSRIKHFRLDFEFHSHLNVDLLRKYMSACSTSLTCLDIRNMPLVEGRMTMHQQLINVSNSTVGVGGIKSDLPVFWTENDGPRRIFPTVKRLELWNYNSYVGNMGQVFLEDLLQAFPSLEELKLVDRYYTDMMNHILNAIIRNPLWVPKITTLIFDNCGSPTVEDIRLLSELNLHLKVLRIGTLPDLSTGQEKYLQIIINKQSPTLRELQFGNYVGETPVSITLPVFPRLKIFELTQDVPRCRQYNVQFTPVKYAEIFPQLQILSNSRTKRFYQYDDLQSLQRCPFEGSNFFRGMTELWKSLFPNDGQVCYTLRILDLPYPKNPDTPFFRRIAKMFPEVNNESLNALRGI